METNAPTWRSVLLPLGFSALCIVLAIGVFRAFGGTVPFQAQDYRITVNVPEGDALFANSDVRMAGVSVGKVVKVTGGTRSAELLLEIDAEYAPVRTKAKAIVRNKSLLGEGYLEITPGPRTAPEIADGGRMSTQQVVRAQRLDDVLQTFSPRTRAQLRQMASGMSKAFDGRAGDLNDALGRARPVTANMDVVLSAIDEQRGDLRQLLASSADVFGALGDQSGALRAAVAQSGRVFAVTADRDEALQATLAAIPPFMTDLRQASNGIDRASGDIRTAVAALRPTVPLLTPALNSVVRSTDSFSNVLRRIRPALKTGTTALPAVDRTLDEVGPPLDRVHMASRQLLPFLQLAAADRESILANFANVAATWAGRTIAPGGKRQGYLGAWLTVWNEITGGWTKKLPTNRSNPYPKPGPLGEVFAKNNGILEAYDCRNQGNPLILPAFGAAPPCKTQGAYEFNGKKAYYPRLELPAP